MKNEYLKLSASVPREWKSYVGLSKNFVFTNFDDLNVDTLNVIDSVSQKVQVNELTIEAGGQKGALKPELKFDIDWALSRYKSDTLLVEVMLSEHVFISHKIIGNTVISNLFQESARDTIINGRDTTVYDSTKIPVKNNAFILSGKNLKNKFLYGAAEVEIGPYSEYNNRYRGNHIKLLMRRKYYFRTSRPKDSVDE